MNSRFRSAIVAASLHFGGSLAVAAVAAILVFVLWYPAPFSELIGGRELFLILISVDAVCGPLLTFVVFNPAKPRQELLRDIGIIVVLQIGALLYGLWSLNQARPVYLAFEGDRFRVVRMADIDPLEASRIPADRWQLSLDGLTTLGVRLAKPTDADYLKSIQESLEGNHPAFRPSRWLPYAQQRNEVLLAASPIAALEKRISGYEEVVADVLRKTGLPEGRLKYLPMIAGRHTDWIVVLDAETAEPVSYLHIDGW